MYRDSYIFPYNPDPLARGNIYNIYDEMRSSDEQVKAAINIKKDMAIGTGWKLNCDNDAIRVFIENNLREELPRPFDEILREILTAYEFGFSVSEPVYQIKDGKYFFKEILVRPPHSFQFNMDDYGAIKELVQYGGRGLLTLDYKKFIHYIYQSEFGNPYGVSDLRAAHPAWTAKKFTIRFMAMFLERFAGPTVIGKFPGKYTDAEIDRVNTMLKSISQSTTITLPDDVLIEFIQSSKDSSDIYTKAIELFNTMIARAILVPDLMGLSGTHTKGGSLALGKTQFDVFISTIKKDREYLQRVINSRLIRPLVTANFGNAIKCDFQFSPFTESDETEYLKIWADTVKGKVFIPNEEEINYFRSQLKFPQGAVNIAPEPTPQPAFQDKKPFAKKERFLTYRQMTPYEKKVDFSQIKESLDSAEEAVIGKLQGAAKRIYSDFISQVRTSNMIDAFRPEKVNKIVPKFQRDMNVVFKRYYTDLFKQSYEEARQEIVPLSKKKFDASDNEEDFLMPEDFLKIIEAESFKQVGDYTMEVTKKMKNILMEGIKDGLTQSDIVSMLKDEADRVTDNWLSTVIRTKTTEIYNQARKSYFRNDPIAKQIVSAYQFSAILDDRTTEVCASLDGNIYEDGQFVDDITPPLHFNCRSMLVPITKFEDYEADEPEDLGDLKDMGGGLILNSLKYSAIDKKPDLKVASIIKDLGDNIIVPAPPKGCNLLIKEITLANLSHLNTVVVGIRSNPALEIQDQTLLKSLGGSFHRDYGTAPWKLPEGEGLFANLSLMVEVSATVRYVVIDKNGKRVE